MIRKAKIDDLNRIAEIEVFNYRLKFSPSPSMTNSTLASFRCRM